MPIGLVISDTAIKIVKGSGKRLRLLKIPLPPHLIRGGTILDQEKLATELTKIAKQYGLRNEPIVLGISEKHIYTKTITIQNHTTNYEDRITQELDSSLPLPLSESYTDWQIVNKQQDVIIVFVASAPAILLDGYIQAFQKASLTLVSIEPLVWALVKQVPQGKEKSLLVILEEDSILFTIVSEQSWIELTSVIPLNQGTQLTEILTELSNMLLFYEKKTRGAKVGKILITGEGVTEEIKQSIATHTSLPAEFLSIKQRTINQQDAVGLYPVYALTDIPKDPHAPILNLLPKDIKTTMEQRSLNNKVQSMVQLIAVLFCILDLCYIALIAFLWWNIQTMNREITATRSLLQKQQVQTAKRTIEQINSNVALANSLLSQKNSAIGALEYFLNKTPAGITITEYIIDAGSKAVTINGISLERERLLTFGKQLETDGYFTTIKIPLKDLEKRGSSTFTITMQLKE